MTVAVLSHFVMEPAGLPGSIHIHTDWDPNARYNKWEIDEGQSAYEDLGGLQAIFEDLPLSDVTVTARHPLYGIRHYVSPSGMFGCCSPIETVTHVPICNCIIPQCTHTSI